MKVLIDSCYYFARYKRDEGIQKETVFRILVSEK